MASRRGEPDLERRSRTGPKTRPKVERKASPKVGVAHDAPSTVTRRELLVAESDEEFRHLVHGMLAFSERIMAVRQGFGQVIGLSGIEYTVLVSIAHLAERGQVSVNTIASHLHLSGAFVTTVTNQLVQKNLIRKSRDRVDRRRAVLTTTTNGQRLLAELAPLQQQVNDTLFEPLTKGLFRELTVLVDPLVEAGDRALALLEYLRRK